MFWGLIMEPQKRYSQVIKRPFHISKAALDLSNSDGQPSQIMVGYEGRNYLLCTLRKPDILQCTLDLNFEEGTTVSFATNGKSHVHLTGYLVKDVYEDEEEVEDQEEFQVSAQKHKRSNDSTEKQSSSKKARKTKEVLEEEEESDDSIDLEKLTGMPDKDESTDDGSDDFVSTSEEEEAEEEEEDEDYDPDDENMEKVMDSFAEQAKKRKKEKEAKVKKGQQSKESTPLKQTPGPKVKKPENGTVEDEKKKGKEEKKGKQNQSSTPSQKVLAGGVIIEDMKEGHGAVAGNGKFVYVYYEGFLKGKKKPFDTCSKSPGFGFRLGKGEVIKGWDIALEGMKVGGKRRVTIPPHLGYGAKGSLPAIPPNSTLVFEIDLLKMK
ncbi:hypothetical protein WA026_007393 [Henosepilachna vigintioctopunctata]|uniref:FK506-binding protein n=1 Tax=Henosepilachna vigintioctopunctata TaxID=420089 RepID=A0AAW1UU09_9CUCU